jgi:hypothetical protein
MLGARRSVKSVTMLERASICMFVLAGISEQKVEEIEGKIARSVRNLVEKSVSICAAVHD